MTNIITGTFKALIAGVKQLPKRRMTMRYPEVQTQMASYYTYDPKLGVAKAGYFPDLTLTGQDQYSSNTFSRLIRNSNRVWAVGPSLAQTLFDGGLVRAQVKGARAAYEGTIDTYRQTVLTSFQQVEDQIVTLRVLEQEGVIEDETVKAAREAEALTLNQYKAGTVPYSSVITAQTTRLSAEETALQVLSSRLQASVALIEALGGGWNASMASAK